MVPTAIRKMIVSPTSSRVSAISYGVFCRSAPSTSAIIRSRKPWPGLTVTRTRISSEMTRVPAVTALRSPPASRITGALSPVIAASLTDATPATTSPSDGMRSPVSTSTMSPTLSALAGIFSHDEPPSFSRLADNSALAARSDAACALPRPSASASAKVPNSTVSHSQTTSCSLKPVARPSCPTTSNIVSSVATTAVVNITGLRISARGLSLRKASPIAGTISSAVNRDLVSDRAIGLSLEKLAARHREMVGDGTKREAGQESQAADDQHNADQQAGPEQSRGREAARRRRRMFLRRQAARDRQHRYDDEETADPHRHAQQAVIEGGVRGEARKRRSIVPDRAGEGVEDFGKAVRPLVERAGEP